MMAFACPCGAWIPQIICACLRACLDIRQNIFESFSTMFFKAHVG